MLKHPFIAGLLFELLTVNAVAQDVIRIGTTALPPTLGNPFRNTGTPHIYTWSATFDGLTRIDFDGNLKPWLAADWETTSDLTWVFRLRDDIVFSNGVPFTADAVVSVFDYLTSDAAVREAVAREFSFVKSARAIDDHTVEITTHEPAPILPRTLPLLHMVEPGQWNRLGPEGFAREPVGTGPYHPVRFGATKIEYEAVLTSWRKPHVARLEKIAAPEAYARTQAVLSNQMDIAIALGPEEADAIAAAGGVGLNWPTAAMWAINFHHGKGNPLDDIRVREALNLAVDRRGLVDGLLSGIPELPTQPATSVTYGFDPSLPPIPFDRERAKQLLSDAGYPEGFSFIVQGVIGSGANDAAMYQKVAQDLATVGVIMEIRTFPVTQLIRSVMEGGWNGDAFGVTFASEPTVDVLRPLRNHSCLWTHPWYCDERIMPAINEALVTFDVERGLELRHDIMKFYRDEWVALYLYQIVRFAGTRANVRGFSEVHGYVSYEDIHFVEE
ncbi:MAG: ABC transporter substrate-binding protein [Rhodospirillaceae bacterium]|jgi:peptide/nickel transport system substrate-binding protein|nr:ABC transporter substrate-binding protein [Rhodospirillaceae bacterium]